MYEGGSMNTINILLLFAAGFLLWGIFFGFVLRRAWRNSRYMRCLTALLASLLFFMAALVMVLVAVGMKGYKALTREEPAATVYITPLKGRRVQAKIVRPGAPDVVYEIAGDELYVDARILKWKPVVNLLGLHTAYCLDRVAGRYKSLEDEKTKERTIFPLSEEMKPWDLFLLRTRYKFLAPLLDAEYGSASYATVKDVTVMKILVTTSGLIIRVEKSERN